jgi:hypothetical protein
MKEEYQRRSEDHVFAASRAAVKEVRYGMMENRDACLWPESYPRGEKKLPLKNDCLARKKISPSFVLAPLQSSLFGPLAY